MRSFPMARSPKRRWSRASSRLMGELVDGAPRPISSSSPATPPRRWCSPRCASASRELPFVGTVPAIKPAALASTIRADLGAGDARHRRARLYPRADPRIRRRLRGDAGRLGAARRPRRARPARRSRRRRRDRARRSRPASSSGKGGAPTRSCSPARIFRCSLDRLAARSRRGRSISSIRPRRSRAGSMRCSARSARRRPAMASPAIFTSGAPAPGACKRPCFGCGLTD